MKNRGFSDKKILVLGHSNVDVMAGPVDLSGITAGSQPMEDIVISYGGGALNEAVILKRLGADVQLVSKVGEDEAGEQLLGFLESEGISCESIIKDPTSPTSVNVVLVDEKGERFFLTDPKGANRKMDLGDVVPLLKTETDIVSFGAMFVSPLLDISALTRMFKEIKSHSGRLLAVDMTKPKNGETVRDLRPCLRYVDFIFPNEEESRMLTGKEDIYENALIFAEAGVKCPVIKRGSKGCIIYDNGRFMEIPAYPVKNAKDTTGAGDSFVAGFLYGISKGFSLEECARFGNVTASCVVEGMGATYGVDSVQKPMERFREMGTVL